MRLIIFIIICQLCFFRINGQNINQNAPNIKWYQIKTDHYKLIFPKELTEEAQRVANTLEFVRAPLTKNLKVEMDKWPLVLSNHGAEANGYVKLAPRMSEWYTTPPQGTLVGTGEWYNLLAIHEGRHMVQYDKFNRGLTWLASILFGQLATNTLSFLSVPTWFWEGDAVTMETALTETGRGRIPDFDLHIRALLLNNVHYSYYKAYMRSYKHYYPNWYTLGYLMTTYVKRHNPPDTWDKIHNRVAWFSVSPFRFSRIMKKYTGLNARQTYHAAMNELDSIYQWQTEKLNFTDAKVISKRKNKVYLNYSNPHYYSNEQIIATYSGMAEDNYIINIDATTGKVTKLLQAPIYEKMTLTGDWAIWNEYHYDKRYLNQNYSDIVVYNVKTGEKKQLTQKGRYFVPEISPDITKIVCIEFTTDRKCYIVIIDFKTGEVIRKIPEKDNEFIQMPIWSEDGNKLVYTRQQFHGKALTILDLTTGQSYDLIPHSWENIANPFFFKDFIIYESPYSGIDNIYAINIHTKQRFQITSGKFCTAGAMISDNGTKMLYQDYTLYGYDIVETEVKPDTWKKIEDVEVFETRYFEPLIAQETGKNIFNGIDSVPTKQYPVTYYNQCANSLNFHSWTILPMITTASFSLMSNDILNTTSFSLNANYNLKEKTWGTGFNLSYARYYPIFSLSGSINNRSTDIDSVTTDLWNEKAVTFLVDVPWFHNKGAWQQYLNFHLVTGITNVSGREYTDSFTAYNGNFIPFNYSLSFSNSRSSAMRDLDSRFSQSINIYLSHIPFGGKLKGSIFSLNSSFNFPGLVKHHVITLEADYEKRVHETYWFASNNAFTRGYDAENMDNFTRFAASYRLPLLYPDLAIGALGYLKRVKGALFYDHGFGNFNNASKTFRSAGFELEADFNVLNLPVEISTGFGVPYLIDNKQWGFYSILMGLRL